MSTEEKIEIINHDMKADIEDPQEVEAEELEQPVEDEADWKVEAEKSRDLLLRAQADMENVKKRLEREKTEFLKFANENLIKDLLPVLDNLERALNHAREEGSDANGIAEGVQLTMDGFKNVLEKFGVAPIKAKGERFDPNYHEAVMQQESPDGEENVVLEEVQKGYLLNDRLIRPTMVVVSRKPN